MTGWTSISVTEEQKAELESHKPDEMAMGKFLVRVVTDGNTDTEPMQVVPIEDVAGRDVPVDSINADVLEQLDRIESGVKEATNAAQSADRKLEELGR